MNTETYVDGVLVHWGEELVWDDRKAVKKSPADPLKALLKAGLQVGRALQAKDVREHVRQFIARSPQVVVKITGGGADMRRIGAHMDYIARGGPYKKKGVEELELETDEGLLVTGKEARALVKSQWEMGGTPIPKEIMEAPATEGVKAKRARREALNVIFSMPAGIDRESVKHAARATAKSLFGGNHQYVMAHHNDTDSQHAHVAVKMVGHDGVRLNPRKADLANWRIEFARQLKLRGIDAAATRRRVRLQRSKGDSQAVRQMRDRGVQPERDRTSSPQTAAAARAKLNEKKFFDAYSHIAQALSQSPLDSDRVMARGLRSSMQAQGIKIKLTRTVRLG